MSSTASTSDKYIPRIVLTTGEPAGIGPDIIIDIARRKFTAELIVVADPELLLHRAELLGVLIGLEEYDRSSPATMHEPGRLRIIPLHARKTVTPGIPEPGNAPYVLESIDTAVNGCLQGEFNAMVTGPVNKAVINEAGTSFTGHTEYIAGQCGNHLPVMMLLNDSLRIALVTTHMPLSRVTHAITSDHLSRVIRIVHCDLQEKMGINNPRLLICGLNPHAGEAGFLGKEELEIIIPVLEQLRREGLALTGPVPADTAFTPEVLRHTDAVITMYHDQGLPVLKSQSFGEIVNVTLGLPLIRTSVDHGTALNLAGTGRARSGSLRAAINCAINMVLAYEQGTQPANL